MKSIKTLTALAAGAFVLSAGSAAFAQTPYSSTPYGQTQTQTDPIAAILGALFGDRLGTSTTLDSEWSRGRRPLDANRTQFETRLQSDVRSGAISSSAASSLSSEYYDLVTLEARYTADGRVTTQEGADLAERYRTFSTRYQAGGQGGYDDGYGSWRPLSESRSAFTSRLDAGVRNRTLTRSQATRLSNDFNALVQLETGYDRNGIDARERADLEARWADLNRRVGDNYDGGYDTPGGNYGSDPRGAEIEARIAAGERNRSISRTEAASLRQELRDLTRRWSELEARVEQARR